MGCCQPSPDLGCDLAADGGGQGTALVEMFAQVRAVDQFHDDGRTVLVHQEPFDTNQRGVLEAYEGLGLPLESHDCGRVIEVVAQDLDSMDCAVPCVHGAVDPTARALPEQLEQPEVAEGYRVHVRHGRTSP
ncbi:hypothetical protein IN07_18440 [Modestobacter caceresii]|uniref:Uncharacterized protein n=1 Tax=Modestobacter caceresii TaxID=1522368 RepID=A0A098Y459_9ACTN|nr:hypothetical protein IN07_18440 [Modestobacter caceresii]